MRILFIGDIVGSPGRRIVHDRLADTVAQQQVDLVIANCENAAAGFGITPRLAEELLDAGIDVLTGGNHIFDKRELLDYFAHQPRLLRPANYPTAAPGAGLFLGTTTVRPGHSAAPSSPATDHGPPVAGIPYAVLSLQGRTFMPPIDCPFRAADRELARIPAETRVILVDFHAETTSEKIAVGYYLDGRVSAVVGTHTHVPTADERVLPGGTAYITDVGMTGPHNGVIGMDKDAILGKFLDALPARFEPATADVQLHSVLLDVDPATGKASAIFRLKLQID